MKQFIVRALCLLGLAFSISNGYAQTNIANCPKKGTGDCPLVKNCPKKGTKDCLYTASFAQSTNSAKADECPLLGTPECPLIKNCPKNGTSDCTLVKMESGASYAAKTTTSAKKKNDADLPACCRIQTN